MENCFFDKKHIKRTKTRVKIFSINLCVSMHALLMCPCHQFIFVVAMHFGLFYLTNYKRAVFVFPCVCVCVCVSMIIFALWMFSALLEVCHFISIHVCSALFLILTMNFVHFLCGVSSNRIIQNAMPPQK